MHSIFDMKVAKKLDCHLKMFSKYLSGKTQNLDQNFQRHQEIGDTIPLTARNITAKQWAK